jgi:hypothetical protein
MIVALVMANGARIAPNTSSYVRAGLSNLVKIAKVHCQGEPVSWWRRESRLAGHFGTFLAHESPIGEHDKTPEKENAAKSLVAGLAYLAAVGS